VGANISPIDQTLSADAITGDLETAFQLLYLAVTQPRIDTALMAVTKSQMRAAMENQSNQSPEEIFRDTVLLTMAQHHPLVRLPSPANIDSLDPQRSLAVYRDRFSDMSGFRFVIVGNFELDSIAPLVTRYLASLPGHGRVETPRDVGIRPPTGMVHKVVHAGSEPKATTILSFYGPITLTPENEWNVQALAEVIKLRLLERLRQEMGGTYTPGVQASFKRFPEPSYAIDISFTTSPERDEELTRATLTVLDSLQRMPALAEDVEKVRVGALRSMEPLPMQDGFWLQAIASAYDLGRPFADLLDDRHIRHWTAADVQRTAKQYLNLHGYARFDLLPATTTTASQ
jgi:zinc protease